MVAGQNAVGHPGIIKNPGCVRGVFPLAHLIAVVHNVTGMDDILDFPAFRIVHDPLVLADIVVLIALGVILGIGDPCEGEVVVGGTGWRCCQKCRRW